MNKALGKFWLAAIVYAGFAAYLYYPHFGGFGNLQLRDLFVVNACLAALGCFLLSRRWVGGFWGSFFAGAVYGFGPFQLGLAGYHPAAGFLAAIVPWLFCPAALGFRRRRRWLSGLLSVLPFVAIVLFFQIGMRYRLFPIPVQIRLKANDLVGLLAPLVAAQRGINVIGFYHVPIASLIMGFFMLVVARRFGVIAILIVGTVLAFCGPIMGISPFMWFAIPAVCCSVVIGEGMQGLTGAGLSDRSWVLTTTAVMAGLCLITLLMATKCYRMIAGLGDGYANLLVEAAIMYLMATVVAGLIFFMARARLRAVWLRWVVVCSAIAVDIFLGARFIIDRVF